MENKNDLNQLTPEENQQAENELLKIKLKNEFGMGQMNSSLDSNTENDWLNYIYNFEKAYAEQKRCKVYDFLGRPEFSKADEMIKSEITVELERILEILDSNGIRLDVICDYEEEVIYRFITEELFEHEMDDMRMPGMNTCFIYEEFHPNHDYDIRKNATEFVNMLTGEWSDYMTSIILAMDVNYNDGSYDQKSFSEIIKTFQGEHRKIELQHWAIESADFDLESYTASVSGSIRYKSAATDQTFEGKVVLRFKLEYDIWSVSSVVLPGFSS